MLVIRLSRVGRKNKPYYRLVLQEQDWSPSSKSIEILGNYNPHANPAKIVFDVERVKYWLSKGAQPSATVHNMLVNAKILTGAKKRVVRGKKVEKKEADKEAAKKPAAEAKPAETKK